MLPITIKIPISVRLIVLLACCLVAGFQNLIIAQSIPNGTEGVEESADFESLMSDVLNLEKKDYRRAIKRAQEAESVAARQKDPLWQVKFLNEIAWSASHIRELDLGLAAAEKAQQIADKHGLLPEKGDASNFKGLLYYEKGDYKRAELEYLHSIEIRSQLGDVSGVASCHNNLARIHIVQRQYEWALKYLNEGLTQIENMDDARSLQIKVSLLNNKGLVSSLIGPDTNWLEAFQDAWELAVAMDSTSLKIEILTFAVDACVRYKKIEQLSSYLEQARELTRGGLEYRWQNNFAAPKGKLLFLQGHYDAAIELLERTLENHKKSDRKDVYLQGIHETLMHAHEAKGDYSKALEHSKALWEIGSQLHEEAIKSQLYQFQIQYESLQKQSEIEQLNQELEQKKLILNHQELRHRFIIFIVGLLLLLIAVLLVMLVLRVQSHRKIKRLNENLEAYQQIAAHDLKNPLSAIMGCAGLLLDEEQVLPQSERKQLYRFVENSSQQGFEIVENLLEFHKIREGQFELNPSHFQLSEFLDNIKTQFQQHLVQKDQTVLLDCSETIKLYHDPFALSRILDNLISNAIKYSPKGSEIAVKVSRTNGKPQSFRIEVMDHGPGIKEEEKDKLFKRFSKLSSMPTGGEHSTGLGLSIAHELSNLLKGKLSAHNLPGGGSCFRLELPLESSKSGFPKE